MRLLESCQKEGISSPEIAELMDFARQEADRRQKNNRLQELLKQAQDLMSRGRTAGVVELLAPIKEEPETASLLFLLEDARNHLQSFQRQIDESLHFATVLATREQHAEAIKSLESQEPAVLQSEPVQTALQRLRAAHEEELATLQAIGRAYAALDRFEIDAGIPQNLSGGASPLSSRILTLFALRRKMVADRQLSAAMEQARAESGAGNRKQALRTLKTAKTVTEYASSDLRDEWLMLTKNAEKGKVFGRSGQS